MTRAGEPSPVTTSMERLRAANGQNFGRISGREVEPPKVDETPVPRWAADLNAEDELPVSEVDEWVDAQAQDTADRVAFARTELALTPLQIAKAHMRHQATLVADLQRYRAECMTRIEQTQAEIAQVDEALRALGHVEASDAEG